MSLIAQMKERILATGAPVFRIVAWEDGQFAQEELQPNYPCLLNYSISKNFTATAIGLAEDRGLLRVSDPILKYFPEYADRGDERMQRVTVEHLLNQRMGIDQGYLFETDKYDYPTDDWLGLIFSRPLEHEPGEKFVYSNTTIYLLGHIVRRATGLGLDEFLRLHLFRPLGVQEFMWERCPKGEIFGATGLYMRTLDMAKLGVLYAQDGVWEGRRILSEDWVRRATTFPEGREYNYTFWKWDRGYQGNGAHCQILAVVPERRIVFAAHAYMDNFDYNKLLLECL
jgi:CubicO group peptidase (beta-lactamase class C family)